MRVLQAIHDFLPDHRAGSEIYTYHLSRALQARGHDVAVLCTEKRPERPQFDVTRGTFDGLDVHEVVYNRVFHDVADMDDDPAMDAPVGRVLDDVRPEVLHVQSLVYMGLALVRSARRRGIPIVMTLHEYFLLCPRGGILWNLDGELCDPIVPATCARCIAPYPIDRARYASGGHDGLGELRFFARAIEARRERLLAGVAGVHRFVAPSRFLRDRMVREGLAAERVIACDYGFPPVERPARRVREPGAPLRLGFLGTLADYKGVHVAVDALARLPEGLATLSIHGATDWFPEYVGPLAERATRIPGVAFAGPLPLGEAPRFLAGLDALVVPSLWYENSPLTIHEAFQVGVPVLASDLGGMAELLANGGGLTFRCGDPDDLARCIRRLAAEPGLLERLATSIPAVKSIDANAAEMERLYRDAREASGRGL